MQIHAVFVVEDLDMNLFGLHSTDIWAVRVSNGFLDVLSQQATISLTANVP